MEHIANFSADELHQISKQGLLKNRPIATSIGGHLLSFRTGRLLYDSDTICDYYLVGAAKDWYISVFHVYDAVHLTIEHSHSRLNYTFSALYSYQGEENAPAGFRWYFGDGSDSVEGQTVSHQFSMVTNDTLYKVSLRVRTNSGMEV